MSVVWIIFGVAVAVVTVFVLTYDRGRRLSPDPDLAPSHRFNNLLLAGEAMFALVLIGVSLL